MHQKEFWRLNAMERFTGFTGFMGTFQSIEEAREFFKQDRFAYVNGMRIDELTDDVCRCSMDLRDDHKNAVGGIMGGVMYTLADFAFAAASNHAHRPTVALDVHMNYLSMVKGTRLSAEAVCLKNGRTTSVYQVTVTDDTGRKIALFTGTGYKL